MPDLVSMSRQAGFSDQEISDGLAQIREQGRAAGFSDKEINDYFGMPSNPQGVPPALMQRMQQGNDLSKALSQLPQSVTDIPHEAWQSTLDDAKDIVNRLGPQPTRQAEQEGTLARLERTGAGLGDIAFLPFAPIQGALRSLVGHPIVAAADAVRAAQVKMVGEQRQEQIEGKMTSAGVPPLTSFPEASRVVDTALMALGGKPMVRVSMGPLGADTALIGGLPKGQDFADAARVIGNGDATPLAEKKLSDLYEQQGIHPAEVVHDAQRDPTIAQSMLSSDKADLPAAYPERIVSAAVRINGHVFSGPNHVAALEEASRILGDDVVQDAISAEIGKTREEQITGGRDGFMTSSGRFVSRKEADEIAGSFGEGFARAENIIQPAADNAVALAMKRPIVETPMPSGANSSKDINGPVYVDPRVPQELRRPVAVHETVEQVAMGQGMSYAQAHQLATQAEKQAVEAAGMNWEKYTHEWDGLLDATEHEKVSQLPPDLHVDPEAAIGHHRSENKGTGEPSEDILAERQPSTAGAAAGPQPSYSDAERQILSKISIDEKAPTRALTWDRLYTNFLDRLYPIAKAVKGAGTQIPTESNPYHLARLMAGYAGKADHFLNNGTFDFRTFENNGKPLKEILAPVADDLNGFRAYAAAARALELEERGIKSGFDVNAPSAPPLVSQGLDAARTVIVEGRDRFEKPFRELVDYQNRVSQYLRDSGVLSKAGYDAMLQANKLYVPFSRVMGLKDDAAHIGGSSLQARNPIKAIKGSARDIIDPIESIVRNTYHFVEMAERNQVGTKLVDMLMGIGDVLPEERIKAIHETLSNESSDEKAIADALKEVGLKSVNDLAMSLFEGRRPDKEGEISVLRDGKRRTYQVDPELARAMKGLDAQSTSMLERMLTAPASTLRAGAVMTPDFWGRHILRDFLYAATTFKGGVFNPIDMAKGMTGLVMKDKDYWDWLKGGGGNISSVGIDRRYLQENLRQLTGQTGLAGRAWNVLTDPDADMWQKGGAVGKLPFQAISKFVLDPLRAMTQFAENASHLGAFKKSMRIAEQAPVGSIRDQILRSAYASRDTAVDAARIGANMRAWNMITAFANIKLQDTDRVVRAVKDNPIGTLVKIGGAITAPSVALWAANHDDPRYQEIPQWEKDMFWLVMTPDHVFRIPKPWAMGMIFGTLPERLLDAFAAQKPDAFKDYIKDTAETLGPGFVPTAAAPIIDQFANRSTFTNRTLIPSAQEKFLPEYQYTPYTTQLARELGQIIGAFPGVKDTKLDEGAMGFASRALTSPILLENYIRGWSGNLGMYALSAADSALRKQGILPDPPQPASTLADIPFVKAFVVRYPSASAQSIQDFYDAYGRAQAYFQTYQAQARDGNLAAMQHIVMMGGPQAFLRLDGIAKALGQQQKLVRDIYKNPEIAADEKRQLIDQLYFGMIQTAHAGNQAIAQASASLARVPEGAVKH